jgi:hypothetical protein
MVGGGEACDFGGWRGLFWGFSSLCSIAEKIESFFVVDQN